jgi:hypothetical protein
MSTKIFLSLLFTSSLFVTACKKELEPQESFTTSAAPTTIAETGNKTTATAANTGQIQQNITPNATLNTTLNTTSGMNPAHGQPGHRCDIAVGAPLNPAANKTVSTQATAQVTQPVSTVVQPTQTTIAPGTNPPHGQPGHRCDIKTGEPLNSPASKTVASTPKTTSGSVSMPINVSASEANQSNSSGASNTPAILNPATTSTAPGMNPAHGQPGHVCSVAVGAPLPK